MENCETNLEHGKKERYRGADVTGRTAMDWEGCCYVVLIFIFTSVWIAQKRVKWEEAGSIVVYYYVYCAGFEIEQSIWPLSVFFPLKWKRRHFFMDL